MTRKHCHSKKEETDRYLKSKLVVIISKSSGAERRSRSRNNHEAACSIRDIDSTLNRKWKTRGWFHTYNTKFNNPFP
jgi:hypothetical protein